MWHLGDLILLGIIPTHKLSRSLKKLIGSAIDFAENVFGIDKITISFFLSLFFVFKAAITATARQLIRLQIAEFKKIFFLRANFRQHSVKQYFVLTGTFFKTQVIYAFYIKKPLRI